MSGPMSPCPENHPLMIAWKAYQETDDFKNTRRWAVIPEHVQGSLWAAFMAGFNSAISSPSEATLEALVVKLGDALDKACEALYEAGYLHGCLECEKHGTAAADALSDPLLAEIRGRG